MILSSQSMIEFAERNIFHHASCGEGVAGPAGVHFRAAGEGQRSTTGRQKQLAAEQAAERYRERTWGQLSVGGSIISHLDKSSDIRNSFARNASFV